MKLTRIGLAAVFAAAFALAAKADDKPASTTLTGEVLDLSCYAAHGAMGADHAKCGKQCLLGGSPAGLLTGDDKLIVLVEDHAHGKAYKSLARYCGVQASVTGAQVDKNGVPMLAVEKVEKASK